MPDKVSVTIDECRKYLKRMRQRYVKADRKGGGRLLDEMETVTELHRKSLFRLLHGNRMRQENHGRQQRDGDRAQIVSPESALIGHSRLLPTETPTSYSPYSSTSIIPRRAAPSGNEFPAASVAGRRSMVASR
jgi:hypothetical protein